MPEEPGNNGWLFCRKVRVQGGPAPTTLILRGVKAFAWPGGVWASTGQVDSSRELWNNSKTDPFPAKRGTGGCFFLQGVTQEMQRHPLHWPRASNIIG